MLTAAGSLPDGLAWFVAPAARSAAVDAAPVAGFVDFLAVFGTADTTRDDEVACAQVAGRLAAHAPIRVHTAAVRASAPDPQGRPSAREPVRLHVYQDPTSGTVQAVVGLDVGVASGTEQQLLAAIRLALTRDGTELARLVCNGRQVDPNLAVPARRRSPPEGRA
ncbi:MAG TPA: hypothetical protein VEA40_26175 [Ramlibacter sp.]|nr:hypothetical protein [Ramlibacter sp.]